MTIRLRIGQEAELAVFDLSAPLSVQDFCSAFDLLFGHPRFRRGASVLAVLDKDSVAALTGDDTRVIAFHQAGIATLRGWAFRVAIVATADSDYGTSRMYAAWADNIVDGQETRVFREFDDARAWALHAPGSESPTMPTPWWC